MFFQFLVGGVIFAIATLIPMLGNEGFKDTHMMSISSSGSHRFHGINGKHIGHGHPPIGHNRPLAPPPSYYGGTAHTAYRDVGGIGGYGGYSPWFYAPYCSYEDYIKGLCLVETVFVPVR